MPADNVRIERIKLKDLRAVAARFIDNATPGTFIPITKHRAESMTHNPYGDPDDVALLLATEGERCVGYFGVMAVQLAHLGKLHKVHWLTTWAVSDDHLGKGLGSRLMEEALALDVDLAIVGSKPARRVSAKYGFVETKPLEYVQLDFGLARRFNPISLAIKLIQKQMSGLRASQLLGSIDRAAGVFFQWLFWPLIKVIFVPNQSFFFNSVVDYGVSPTKNVTGLLDSPVYMSSFQSWTPQTQLLVEAKFNQTRFSRDSKSINWMLDFPWVVKRAESTSQNLNYVFTDWRQEFKQVAMRFWLRPIGESPERELGYATFQYSKIKGRRILKALDTFTINENWLSYGCAVELARKFNAEIIEGGIEFAEHVGWRRKWVVRHKQRVLQLHPRTVDSPLAQALPTLAQHYTDGDMAFT